MDEQDFQALLQTMEQQGPGAPGGAAAAIKGADSSQGQPQGNTPSPAQPAQPDDAAPSGQPTERRVMGLNLFPDSVGRFADAVGSGALEAGFQTKDFLFGPTPESERSTFRRASEDIGREATQGSVVNSLAHGISQFATGMLGAGKLGEIARIGQAAEKAGTVVDTAYSMAKAAVTGAVAFDPHQERLSNIVQSVPGLDLPVIRYLEAKPDDTDAEGRVKAAMESIGIDLAAIGLFAGGLKVFRALRSGDEEAVRGAAQELEAQHQQAVAAEAAPEAPQATGTAEVSRPTAEALPATHEAPSQTTTAPTAGGEQPVAGEVTQAKPEAIPAAPTLVDIPDEAFGGIVQGMQADAQAIATSGGSWDAAIAAGHTFGRGGKVPWQKLAGSSSGGPADGLDSFIARVADTLKPQLDELKGGSVLSDPAVTKMLGARAALWGEDPAATLGLLQQAGEHANQMTANMNAGYLIANRAYQDTYAMAARINAGFLDEWGGDAEAAKTALKDMTATAATVFGHAQAMRAAAGRSLRQMRFAVSKYDLANLAELDGDQLTKLLTQTRGDPRLLAKVTHPTFLDQVLKRGAWLFANNLLWGWQTHAVNLLTNAYQVGFRPLERVIGSYKVGGEAGQAVRTEALQQYAKMGSTIPDAWRALVKTWQNGDSILNPHATEVHTVGDNTARDVALAQFRPWDSPENALYNGMLGAAKVFGTPTRALGAVDEMVKQVVYRSQVLAKAQVEGVRLGLDGEALKQHIEQRLLSAFDDAGRATDAAALQEARVATFQQDLLPGTLGQTVQNAVARHATARFVLPFVRTPTNVIRQGVKLTPGLNLLQKEYRGMFMGRMGAEAQAQAYGQMAMGSLLLGTTAFLAHSGYITGGGPSDPKLRASLMSTGWRPYSFVIPHADGTKTYVNYGRFDPVAMPFGIVADLADVMAGRYESLDAEHGVESVLVGLGMSMAKQLQQKTYLRSIAQVVDALMDPDRSFAHSAGQMAANFIPMSSLLRTQNPDDYMRQTRGMMDTVMAGVPGLSPKLPPRRDLWGDPITVNRGLIVSAPGDLVDAEMRRLGEEAGVTLGAPSPSIGGVDLRDITMSDGRNAYDVYQQLAGKPTPRSKSMKDVVARIMQTEAYAKAPDGDAQTRGTKLYMLMGTVSRYRAAALRRVKADPEVRKALSAKQDRVIQQWRLSRSPEPKAATETGTPEDGLARLGKAFGLDLTP